MRAWFGASAMSALLGACAMSALLGACAEPALIEPPPPAPPPRSEGNLPLEVARKPDPKVRLVLLPEASAGVVAMRVVFDTGSADDPPGQEGAVRLAAKWMVEGGTRELSPEQLARKLFPMAARIGLSVDRDQTVFAAEVAARDVEQFYPLLCDVLLEPRLERADFERVRDQAMSTLVHDLRGADDESLAKEALATLVFGGGHPYGHPPLGTASSLRKLGPDEVDAARRRGFCASRMTLGLAGAYPHDLPDRMLAEFSKLSSECPERADPPRAAPPTGRRVLIVDKPNAETTAISLGAPIDVRRGDVDYPAVRLATDWLGLHRNSAGVLFRQLRQKRGLNYGDYGYVEHFEQEGFERFARPNAARRQQDFSLWIRPVQPAAAPFALAAALYYLERLTHDGIAADDLDRARTFLGGYIGLETQTPLRRLGYAIDDRAYGLPSPYADYLRSAWGKLDAPSLLAAVQRHLSPANLDIAIVAKEGRKLAEALVRGEVSPPPYAAPKPAPVVLEDREILKALGPLPKENVRVVPVDEIFP